MSAVKKQRTPSEFVFIVSSLMFLCFTLWPNRGAPSIAMNQPKPSNERANRT